MWKRRVAYRLRVGAKSKELQLPIALQSDSHSARGMQSALLRAYACFIACLDTREFIEIFIRKNETSHKFRKFRAFSEFF